MHLLLLDDEKKRPKKLGGLRNQHGKSPTFLIEKNLQNKILGISIREIGDIEMGQVAGSGSPGFSNLDPNMSNSRD